MAAVSGPIFEKMVMALTRIILLTYTVGYTFLQRGKYLFLKAPSK